MSSRNFALVALITASLVFLDGCVSSRFTKNSNMNGRLLSVSKGNTKAMVATALGAAIDTKSSLGLEAWRYCTTGLFVDDLITVYFLGDVVVGTETYNNGTPGDCTSFLKPPNWYRFAHLVPKKSSPLPARKPQPNRIDYSDESRLRAEAEARAKFIKSAQNRVGGGPRAALVVGNGNYGKSLGKLLSPVADARLVARSLESVGFKTTILLDANQNTLKRAVRDFGQQVASLGSNTTALFYYSGHGVQVASENYLIPVAAGIRVQEDVPIEAVSASDILQVLSQSNARISMMVLDAYRNNPLPARTKSPTKGLAVIATHGASGTLVAYATAPGQVAYDGGGDVSSYSKALAAAIRMPGISVEEMFRVVRNDVMTATGKQQVPWESSALTGAPFYFGGLETGR